MNKRRMIIVAGALLMVAAIARGESEPISGEWVLSFTVQNQTVPGKINLNLNGDTVTGTIYTDHTGPGKVENGKWVDRKLTATLVFEKHESITLSGELKEDGKLTGEFRTEGNVGAWTAEHPPSH